MPLTHDEKNINMHGTKVKLPSIAELTQTSLPIAPTKASPLQPPAMSVEHVSLENQRESVAQMHLPTPGPLPPFPFYSYGPGQPSASPYYLHSYYQPVYYQSPVMNRAFGAPESKLVYSVPEVINKSINKCHRCGTTETPEWRSGPNGLRTLCNACGLFHAKLVKRKGAAIAAEEVLNNKVCKGKNGRRVSVKKHALEESKKRMREAQVTELAPIPYMGAAPAPSVSAGAMPSQPPLEYVYQHQVFHEGRSAPMYNNYPRVALPHPVLLNPFQSLPGIRN